MCASLTASPNRYHAYTQHAYHMPSFGVHPSPSPICKDGLIGALSPRGTTALDALAQVWRVAPFYQIGPV